MLIEQFYREDLTALREGLSALEQALQSAKQGEWKELPEGNNELRDLMVRFDSEALKGLKRARRVLEDVETNVNAEGLSPFGLFLAATAQSFQSEAQGFEAALMAMERPPRETRLESVDRLLNWIRGKILPILKRIMGSVWNILINVLPPQSWKVNGRIGLAFPGLTDGELTIEFDGSR